MAKKPFPFKVCEQCCSGGGTGAGSGVGAMLEPTGAEIFNDYENNTSNIPYAHIEGKSNRAIIKTFLITSYSTNSFTLDSVDGIKEGMSWHLFTMEDDGRHIYTGSISGISGNTIECTSTIPQDFTPATEASFIGTCIVSGGEIGTHEITDKDGNFSTHLEGVGTSAFLNAHAEGDRCVAYGWCSHAEGVKTKAIGDRSHAEGYDTHVRGAYSHAEGRACETGANVESAHAEGYMTHANGWYSHAEGKNSVAEASGSHAEGEDTHTTGQASHAEGSGTKATQTASHAEGSGAQATGNYAHAEGENTLASAQGAHAEGKGTEAKGWYSHAEGMNASATASGSHAEGTNTTASGIYAHAEGEKTLATQEADHAEGYCCEARGGQSHAEGHRTFALGQASHAEGLGTKASSQAQHAEGKYNIEDTDGVYAHIVGNGRADLRSNAYTLDWQGNGRYAGTVEATAIILKSSTEGSKKRFKITIDDNGVLHTEEIV